MNSIWGYTHGRLVFVLDITRQTHGIRLVEQHKKNGAKDTYICGSACAILYMCIPQKAVIVKSIPKNSKSFRQKIRVVNTTNMISGDHGCNNLLATIIIIQWYFDMFVRIPTVAGALIRSKDSCVSTVGGRAACRKQLLVENSLPMSHQRSFWVQEYI